MNNKTVRISNKVCPEGMSIEEWQIALRREQAEISDFMVEHLDDNRIWGDYLVHSGYGRYKVAFRGVCSDRNFCSCLDFRTNGLGTCKHLERVTLFLQQEVPGYPWAGLSYNPPYTSIYVSYKGGRSIRIRIGSEQSTQFVHIYQQYFDSEGVLPRENYHLLGEIQRKCSAISPLFRIYDDVYDFAEEVTARLDWKLFLLNAFEEQRIPWDKVLISEEHKALERCLFDLCAASDGLIVSPKHPIFSHLVGRLAEEVYEGEARPQPGYIIVDTEVERKQWETLLRGYSDFQKLPIEIVEANQFISRISSTHPSVTFIWVDNAKGLRDWQNPLSHALKKLTVSHLYMRLETLSDVSPIQLSSTLQHISPFIMGPLYRFVHGYRKYFPISDDDSNTPKEIQEYLFFLKPLTERSLSDMPSSPLSTFTRNTRASEERVNRLMQCLLEVVEDPDALSLLREKLSL